MIWHDTGTQSLTVASMLLCSTFVPTLPLLNTLNWMDLSNHLVVTQNIRSKVKMWYKHIKILLYSYNNSFKFHQHFSVTSPLLHIYSICHWFYYLLPVISIACHCKGAILLNALKYQYNKCMKSFYVQGSFTGISASNWNARSSWTKPSTMWRYIRPWEQHRQGRQRRWRTPRPPDWVGYWSSLASVSPTNKTNTALTMCCNTYP